MRLMLCLVLAILATVTQSQADMLRCTSWTNSSLSHRGDVTVHVDANSLSWIAESASSEAQAVRHNFGSSIYIDDAFVYLVFGAPDGENNAPAAPLLIRRVPLVQSRPRIGEVTCE
jgi:hypothetical protein